MSPTRRHLRNRKRIKAPKRLEDEYDLTSPRPESPEEGEESEESSELAEEIYESPKPRTPKLKRQAYRGKAIEFNPNLPPAAFPTLDHPDYVHNGGHVPIDLESHLPGSKDRLAGYEAVDVVNPDSLGHNCHPEEIVRRDDLQTLTSTNLTQSRSTAIMQRSKIRHEKALGNMFPTKHGESTDNGPRNPIWVSNMARMKEAGRMSDLDRIMLEMESSDEEEGGDASAVARSAKIARKATGPTKFPSWDDLTVVHKLDLADTIAATYPDPAQVMHQLRLSSTQKDELVELLIQRQDRAAREKRNQQRLRERTQEMLLQGASVSQSTFHRMVEETLYVDIHEDHYNQSNLMELKKAKAYLYYCGFDPALVDSSWDVPSLSNAASGAKPRPAQSKPEGSLLSTAGQTPSGPSEGPFSRRSALSNPSQKPPHLPDPHPELVQQQHTQGRPSQHRPDILAHALIAQDSPAAPPSKVPSQSYRVAAPKNRDLSSNVLRSVYQGMTRTAQQQQSSSSLSASEAQSKDVSSAETDQRAGERALPQASGAFSSVSHNKNQQGGKSLHGGLHSLVSKSLPIALENQDLERNADLNAGASAPQGNNGIITSRDSVTKKKRKKGAAWAGH